MDNNHLGALTLVPASPRPWTSLEVIGNDLMICTDSGCRPARAQDLAEVINLLPEMLERQDRCSLAYQWRKLIGGAK